MALVAVLGAGSWGTALALQLARNGHSVRLWGHDAEHVRQMRAHSANRRYLPAVNFPRELAAEAAIDVALHAAELVLVVVPSHAFSRTLQRLRPLLSTPTGLAWATKGLERGSGRFLHQVVAEVLGPTRVGAVVSGPSFAKEVALGMPTALTVASRDDAYALQVAGLLHGSGMLAYTSRDMAGVELGGAVKNVLAIAAGIADGLGYGANARAAVITRGLAEMVRLGLAVGGTRETFMGLTGVGDLVLTCTDDQSRNRRFGLAIGSGQTFEQARASIGQVVEGAAAVLEVMRLARMHKVDMPISEHIEKVLYREMPPREAVAALLARPPRPELD